MNADQLMVPVYINEKIVLDMLAIVEDIKTVFLTTKPEYNFISSSTIKEILNNGGDISKFVPKAVNDYLTSRK